MSARNKIVTWNPSVFAFISGLLASTATNLLTSLTTSADANICREQILAAATLFLGSAVALIVQSWSLEEPHSQWNYLKKKQREGLLSLADELIEESALRSKARSVWLLMALWIVLFLAGFILLVVKLN